MNLVRLISLFTLAVLPLPNAGAMFAYAETRQVPIDRVLSNLQERLAKNTNDFESTYYLARVYSMAYSTNLQTVAMRVRDDEPEFEHPAYEIGVPPGVHRFATPADRARALASLTNAIQLYERTLVLLKSSPNTNAAIWRIFPTQLGLAWCLEQSGRTNAAIAMYRRTLKAAWKREVTGDFSFKEWASDVWKDVSSGHNPIRTHNRGHLGPGVSYSEETIGYLLAILDPAKDASEIAQLQSDRKTLAAMPRAITPILIPLTPTADLSQLVDIHAKVPFDLDGSGLKRRWAWLTPQAGWLVYDPEQKGQITSALQMFGNVTFWIFWKNGYEALSALDDNHDGRISGAELKGLAVWNDRNGNGVSDPGEVVPVEELGIVSISCQSQEEETGMLWNPHGIELSKGDTRASYDWMVPAAR